jgi:hypothetical protein
MRTVRSFLGLAAFAGAMFFACTDKNDPDDIPIDCDDCEPGISSNSNPSGGNSSGSGTGEPGVSSSSGDVFSALSSSSVDLGLNCAYKPVWCGGIAYYNVIRESQVREVGDGPKCIFATSIESMGNQSQGPIKVNGTRIGDARGLCGNVDWGQQPCADALVAANVQKADGGYYVSIEEWAGDFNTTGGTPVCGGTTIGDNSSSSGIVEVPSSSSSEIASGVGNCVAPGYFDPPDGMETCIVVNGKCYKCNPERGADCLQAWVWQGQQVTSDYWYKEVSCTGGVSSSSARSSSSVAVSSSSNRSSSSVAVSSSSNRSSSSVAASSSSVALTCVGNVPATGIAGTAITPPTIRCGTTAVTSGLTWRNNSATFNWSSPVAGTYSNINATATCGGSSKQANCSGTLVVSPAPTLSCAALPQTSGTAGTAITSPTVKCGDNNIAFNSIAWSGTPSAPNWNNPVANTYSNIRATATCNGASQQATCSGTLTVSAAATLTCASANQTVTLPAVPKAPEVKCGNTVVSSGITWKHSTNTTFTSWSLGAGTYSNINATATCSNTSQTANCAGTVIVNNAAPSSSSVSGGGGSSAPNYPALQQGGAGVQSGYATRYWDACKANCSWSGKAQALGSSTRCKNCSSNGTTEIAASDNNRSSCDGGNAYTCYDQIPYVVNSNLAYAFAATPGSGSDCGKCFQLQFTGTGKYANDANHRAIQGKTLIVISSNTGHDVSGGQFDLLIPGGGVGAYDAFSSQIGVSKAQLGEQYGGLLADCERESNYDASRYKACLTTKCNIFTNSTLKEGCLWLANWMEAANNPNILYKQVECPQYLVDKYKAKIF